MTMGKKKGKKKGGFRPCAHCKKSHAHRPRGLCWTCYYQPGVKELYPVTSKYAPKSTKEYEPQTEAELDAMIAEQRKNLPSWWNEEGRGVGYGTKGAGLKPKP